MARPLKDESEEPLDRSLLVRVTKTQKEQKLPELAQSYGMSEADFSRHRIFGTPPRRKKATPERVALIKALGQLGNIRSDFNQLLKDRQAHRFIEPGRSKRILDAIETIAAQIHKELGNGS